MALNGKDHDGTSLPEVIAPSEGSQVLQQQLAALSALQDQHAARVVFEAQRQMAIAEHKAGLERAIAAFKTAMEAKDYEGAARAARAISHCEAGLVCLGAYHNGN